MSAAVEIAVRDGAGDYWSGSAFDQASIFFNPTGGTTGAWTYSTTTLVPQLVDGHTYTITARPTDLAGNSSTTTRTFLFDSTAPTVTNVTASTANGAYTTGTVVHVQIAFSKNVTVTGTPQLTLNTSPAETASYGSGSGTSTLTFDYTVQAGDNAATLDYATSAALALNGGTIRDAATNDATLTLPTPGAAGSLAANKSIAIDTLVPTVTSVTATDPDAAYKAGDVIHVRVAFSENVIVSGTPRLALNSGATVDYASGSGSSTLAFDYTIAGGENSADLDYNATTSLALNGGTIKDAATNNANVTLASPGAAGSLGNAKNIVVDTTAPTVSGVTSSTANGSYKAGATVSIQVAFSENVTVSGAPKLALNSGGTADYSSGSGTSTLAFTYTVAGGENSADLDYSATTSLTLNGGTIDDAAGNAATRTLAAPGAGGSLGNAKNIVVDTTVPTVTGVTSSTANGSYKAGATVSIQVGFSENVTVTGTPQLTLNSGATVDYASGSGTSTLTFAYTVGAGEASADLDYNATTSLTSSGGTIKDAATNTATLTLASPGTAGSLGNAKDIVIDTTAPTVSSVSASNADGSYTTGDVIHVEVTFGEAVTVTGTPKLTLDTAPSRTADYVSGSGTPTLTFDYAIQAGDSAADLDYAATGSLALNGGTIKDTATNAATLTLASPGAAGSLGSAKNIVIDTTAPTVSSVSASNADGSYKAAAVIHVELTFSDTVLVTGTPKLTLNTTPSRTANYASGSGTSTLTFDYTVQAGDDSSDLDYATTGSLALNGGTIKDGAGNNAALSLPAIGGASSLGGQKNIVIDTVAPTVTSSTVNGTTLDVAYSEALSGSPATSDFTVVVNGTGDTVDGISIVTGSTVRLTLHDAVRHLDTVDGRVLRHGGHGPRREHRGDVRRPGGHEPHPERRSEHGPARGPDRRRLHQLD